MEEITTLLRDLAAELGTTVDYLWPLYFKLMVLHEVQRAIGLIISVPIFFFCFRYIKDHVKETERGNGNWDFSGNPVPFIVFVVLGFGSGIFSICMLADFIVNLGALIYPEAFALRELMSIK